jgi:hypothetical protein
MFGYAVKLSLLNRAGLRSLRSNGKQLFLSKWRFLVLSKSVIPAGF